MLFTCTVGRAARLMRSEPLPFGAFVLSLALGTATAVTAFRVLDALFYRYPTGVSQPASLRRVWIERPTKDARAMSFAPVVSNPDFEDVAHGAQPFANLAAYAVVETTARARGGAPVPIRAAAVSSNFFQVLGVRASVGRLLDSNDFERREPVAVVSRAGLAKLRAVNGTFALDTPLHIGSATVAVVGVTDAFIGVDLQPVDVWLPVTAGTDLGMPPLGMREAGYLSVLARPARDVPDPRLARQLTELVRRVNEDHPSFGASAARTVSVGSIRADRMRGMDRAARFAAAALAAAAAIVLALALGNALIMMLIRVLRRAPIYATRLALGATQRQLVADQAGELAVMYIFALAVGAGIAVAGGGVLRWFGIGDPASSLDLHLVVFVAAAGSVMFGVLALAPAALARRLDLAGTLRASGPAGILPGRIRGICLALLGAQIAISMTLSIGALALAVSVRDAGRFDYGFDVDHLFAISAHPAPATPTTSAPSSRSLMRALSYELSRSGAVATFSWTDMIPFRRLAQTTQVFFADDPTSPPISYFAAQVDTAFFATTGMRLLRGRTFTRADLSAANPPVIVSQSFAASAGRGRGLGQCLAGTDGRLCQPIVGIVGDASLRGLRAPPAPTVYTLTTAAVPVIDPAVLVRVRSRDGAVGELYRAASRVGLPPEAIQVLSMRELSSLATREWQRGLVGCGVIALLACVLAFVGVVAVIAYEVRSRVKEIGIRVALGATAGRLTWAIARRAAVTSAVAASVGATGGYVFVHFMRDALDGATLPTGTPMAGAILLAVGVTAVGILVPARQALRVSPTEALRADG